VPTCDVGFSNAEIGIITMLLGAVTGALVTLYRQLMKQKDEESARLRKERDDAYDRVLSYDRTMQQTFPNAVPPWRGN
jgi:hypothetical protein